MQGESQRELWLDAARVPAMLLIILFHLQGKGATWVVFQPLMFFFLLSGYLTKARSFSYSKWWRRLVALAVPYFLWNALFLPELAIGRSLGRIFGIGPDGLFCADYPLWYLRALFLMMLVYPLFRRIPWIPASVALGFVFWGNSWHCGLEKLIPLPDPEAVSAFFAGCSISACPPATIRKLLQRAGLIPLAVVVMNAAYGFLPHPVEDVVGIFSIPALAAWLPLLPAVCSRLATWSRAVFMALATHCIFVYIAQWCLPEAVKSYAVACPLAISFFAIAWYMLRAMERWCPALLPYLAHRGRLPWP